MTETKLIRPAFTKKTEAHPAPATLILSPEYFAPHLPSCPKEEVCVGIRPLSGADDDYCRQQAAARAWRQFPGGLGDGKDSQRNDAYNDALMRLAIAKACTDANNVRVTAPCFGRPAEEMVFVVLTREGTKAIWDAIERVTIELSPVRRPLSDEEIERLFAVIQERLALMPKDQAARSRRLLGFLLDECDAFEVAKG